MKFLEDLLHLDNLRNIVVNVIGPPGSGKSAITYNYVAQVLNKRQPAVFVVLDQHPEQIRLKMSELTDIDSSTLDDLLIIVDGYSHTVGLKSNTNLAFNASNLSDFSLTLSAALEQEVECVLIDPLSTLVIHNNELSLLKTIQIITAKLRGGASHSFITYIEGIHTQSFYNTVRYLGDINLILKREEAENGEVIRALHVHSSRGAPLDERWRPFTIDSQGRIDLEIKK